MKKMNNKGFAVSTILYGLLIVLILITTLIMSTMAFTRKNNKQLSDEIVSKLEGTKSSSYSSNETCDKEAQALVNQGKNCTEIIDEEEQRYYNACYWSKKTSTEEVKKEECGNELIKVKEEFNEIRKSCKDDDNETKLTAAKSACLKVQNYGIKTPKYKIISRVVLYGSSEEENLTDKSKAITCPSSDYSDTNSGNTRIEIKVTCTANCKLFSNKVTDLPEKIKIEAITIQNENEIQTIGVCAGDGTPICNYNLTNKIRPSADIRIDTKDPNTFILRIYPLRIDQNTGRSGGSRYTTITFREGLFKSTETDSITSKENKYNPLIEYRSVRSETDTVCEYGTQDCDGNRCVHYD